MQVHSLFLMTTSHFRVAYTPHTGVINLSSQQQGNNYSRQKGGQWPEFEPTTAIPGGNISDTIHRQHVPKIAERIDPS